MCGDSSLLLQIYLTDYRQTRHDLKMSAPTTADKSSEQVKFLVVCIKHTEGGKVSAAPPNMNELMV